MTSPWYELIGALIIAIPGILALIQQSKNKKAEVRKTEAEAINLDAETEQKRKDLAQETKLIEISRSASKELISQLETRIIALHSAVKDLEEKCSTYEIKIDTYEKRITDLEREVERKNRRIEELERSEAQKDRRIQELELRVAELENLGK